MRSLGEVLTKYIKYAILILVFCKSQTEEKEVEELRFMDLFRAVLRADTPKVNEILGDAPNLIHRKLTNGNSLTELVGQLIYNPLLNTRKKALISIQTLLAKAMIA